MMHPHARGLPEHGVWECTKDSVLCAPVREAAIRVVQDYRGQWVGPSVVIQIQPVVICKAMHACWQGRLIKEIAALQAHCCLAVPVAREVRPAGELVLWPGRLRKIGVQLLCGSEARLRHRKHDLLHQGVDFLLGAPVANDDLDVRPKEGGLPEPITHLKAFGDDLMVVEVGDQEMIGHGSEEEPKIYKPCLREVQQLIDVYVEKPIEKTKREDLQNYAIHSELLSCLDITKLLVSTANTLILGVEIPPLEEPALRPRLGPPCGVHAPHSGAWPPAAVQWRLEPLCRGNRGVLWVVEEKEEALDANRQVVPNEAPRTLR